MKVVTKFRRSARILAAFLAVVIGITSMPITARAEEEISQITVENLEGLAEPTEFPAEGTMHIHIMKATSMEENYAESYVESYLPVVVDQNKNVYAKLSELKNHLGMRVESSTGPRREQVRTVRYHNSALILKEGDSAAVYTMYVSNGMGNKDTFFPYTHFSIGNAPFMYKDEFYVPLDAFLQCTGTFAFYAGRDDVGKQDLYITPPQKTVLDDLVHYGRQSATYSFSMEKDLGFTEESLNKTNKSAEYAQLAHRLGTIFDGAAWSKLFGGGNVHFDDKYVDMFMDFALHASEEGLDNMIKAASAGVDYVALWLDVAELGTHKGWEESAIITNWFLDRYGDTKQLKAFREGLGTPGDVSFVAGNVLNYWSTCASIYGADQISVNGADLLMNEYSDLLNHGQVDEDNVERVQKNIADYEGHLGLNAFTRWLEEYWLSGGVGFAKILTNSASKLNGVLGLATFASTVWTGGTEFLLGKYIDETENFLTAYFGQRYENLVVPAAREALYAYARGEIGADDTREIVYHAMAACYTTRYFGCMGLEHKLKKNPDLKSSQQKLNKELSEFMAVLQCTNIQMGMTQKDYYSLSYNEAIHYDNVYFNICQVQGRITYWDDGKPADNLEVWISDETGAVLAEFVTDKAGDFDISFPVEDVSIFDEGELKKQITFHIEEWWYPEILETVEIPVFKKCKVNGLWAGEKKETIKCFLEDANEEDGQVILNVRRIEIDADQDFVVNLEMPLFFTEGSYQTYILRSGQYKLGDTIERVVLDDGMTLQTIFSLMYPDGTWAGEFMQIFAGAGISPGLEMDAMMNSDMREADEIYRYIEQYQAINGECPTYEITKVNSQIDTIEPIMIQLTK